MPTVLILILLLSVYKVLVSCLLHNARKLKNLSVKNLMHNKKSYDLQTSLLPKILLVARNRKTIRLQKTVTLCGALKNMAKFFVISKIENSNISKCGEVLLCNIHKKVLHQIYFYHIYKIFQNRFLVNLQNFSKQVSCSKT